MQSKPDIIYNSSTVVLSLCDAVGIIKRAWQDRDWAPYSPVSPKLWIMNATRIGQEEIIILFYAARVDLLVIKFRVHVGGLRDIAFKFM